MSVHADIVREALRYSKDFLHEAGVYGREAEAIAALDALDAERDALSESDCWASMTIAKLEAERDEARQVCEKAIRERCSLEQKEDDWHSAYERANARAEAAEADATRMRLNFDRSEEFYEDSEKAVTELQHDIKAAEAERDKARRSVIEEAEQTCIEIELREAAEAALATVTEERDGLFANLEEMTRVQLGTALESDERGERWNRAEAKMARLRRTLKFYADDDNYFPTYLDETQVEIDCPVLMDYGGWARAALSVSDEDGAA